MNEPLENLYFSWLCAKVLYLEHPTPSLTYDKLLRALHNHEFVFLVSGDDNRAEDGVELRTVFLLEADLPENREWRYLPCSVLEMMVAFSRRAEFTTDRPAADWFWEFIENLGLIEFNDATEFHQDEVSAILDTFIWRTYNFNGMGGGMFPLHKPKQDQKNVEIWYQFCEYLSDQERLP